MHLIVYCSTKKISMNKIGTLALFLSLSGFAMGQSYPDLDAHCGDIRVERDAYSGEARYISPLGMSISFKKLVNNGQEATYMTLAAVSKLPNSGKGLVILFERNGYKITRDVATNVFENEKGEYVHYVEIKLSKDDISKLKNYNISSFEVYMYPGAIENNTIYRAYMHCLTKI